MLGSALAASALGAGIALDDNMVFRGMIAQPICCGSILGLFMGDLTLGATVGAVLQLLWLFDVPAGGFISIDYTSCAAIVTTLVFMSVQSGIPRPLALTAGLAFFTILGIAAGALSASLTKSLRKRNEAFVRRASLGLDEGRISAVWRNHLAALIPMFGKSFAVIFLPVLLGTLLLVPLLKHLSLDASPEGVVSWIEPVLVSAGIGIGVAALWERHCAIAILTSGAAAFFLVRYLEAFGQLKIGIILLACSLITLAWHRLVPNGN